MNIKQSKKQKPAVKRHNRSKLFYNSRYSFYEECNINNFNSLSLESKHPNLASFYNDLNNFNSLRTHKRKKGVCMTILPNYIIGF